MIGVPLLFIVGPDSLYYDVILGGPLDIYVKDWGRSCHKEGWALSYVISVYVIPPLGEGEYRLEVEFKHVVSVSINST